MINRIKEIAAHYGLSSTAFADRIEVARPVISHIFSERNRPSLEVVQKIGLAFPEVSSDWLLYGKAGMLRNLAAVEEPQQETVAEPVAETVVKNTDEDATLNKINPNPEKGLSSAISPAAPSRKIRKVLIFYADQTFEEFNPSD